MEKREQKHRSEKRDKVIPSCDLSTGATAFNAVAAKQSKVN